MPAGVCGVLCTGPVTEPAEVGGNRLHCQTTGNIFYLGERSEDQEGRRKAEASGCGGLNVTCVGVSQGLDVLERQSPSLGPLNETRSPYVSDGSSISMADTSNLLPTLATVNG